jgi:hypothetical protein
MIFEENNYLEASKQNVNKENGRTRDGGMKRGRVIWKKKV